MTSSTPSPAAASTHLTPPGPGNGPLTAELAVTGMHCGSCASLIEEVLTEQDGVYAASVDLDREQARVEYDASRLGLDDLTAAIAGAGYSAAPLG